MKSTSLAQACALSSEFGACRWLLRGHLTVLTMQLQRMTSETTVKAAAVCEKQPAKQPRSELAVLRYPSHLGYFEIGFGTPLKHTELVCCAHYVQLEKCLKDAIPQLRTSSLTGTEAGGCDAETRRGILGNMPCPQAFSLFRVHKTTKGGKL